MRLLLSYGSSEFTETRLNKRELLWQASISRIGSPWIEFEWLLLDACIGSEFRKAQLWSEHIWRRIEPSHVITDSTCSAECGERERRRQESKRKRHAWSIVGPFWRINSPNESFLSYVWVVF